MSSDILAFLDSAINVREQAARATTEHQPYDEWDAVGDDRDTETARTYWEVLKVARMYPTPAARDLANHIALNDPESVLRRCAADRKLIAEHGPFSATDLSCKGCGLDSHEDMVTGYYEDCPVLCALAEGYGWTEGER